MNATFLLQFKAFMIDYIFILIYLVLLVIVNVFLFPSIQQLFNQSLMLAQLASFIIVILPVSFISPYLIQHWSGSYLEKRKWE